MALKAAVAEAFVSSNLNKSEFARRLGLAEIEARHILDPWHPTKTERLEQALLCLGGTSLLETVYDAA